MPKANVTLLAPVPAQTATDYGITNNTAGAVNSIDQQNAENLVHQGLASFGSAAKDDSREGRAFQGTLRTLTIAAAQANAAGQSIVGPVADLGEVHNYDTVRTVAVQDQAGTVLVEHSVDGVTWFSVVAATALVANTALVVEEKIVARFVRATIKNTSATAATATGALNLLHLSAAA